MGERGEPWGTPYSDEKEEEEKPGKHRLVDLSVLKLGPQRGLGCFCFF
jgi:hypothetical protein